MSEIAERLREALAGRYEVGEEIGKGGMAIVLRVRDLRHDRFLALKVLRPELSSSIGAKRFLQEIRLAAGLQHPNILPVHDSGEAGELLYYVMPYVVGESLRVRLDREGQLPVEDALRIAHEVAEALHCAHQRDIVHRDIKPENILLSGGHALVADFGIARAVSVAGGTTLTETGLVLGTPAYMSPEQASGDSRVDGRADVYALGCVLYEMLAGEPPYRGATAQIIAQHSLSSIPSIRNVRPTVPETVERTIVKALAKARADRFESAQAFGAALPVTISADPKVSSSRARKFILVGLVTAGLLLLFAGAWASSRRWQARKSGDPITIAVAPIRNLADTSDAPFADGLTQEFTTALTHARRIVPRPYATVALEAARETNPLALGRKLGVDYVLAATLRRSRQQVRVTAELIRVKDGSNAWAPRTYDGSGADIFNIQDSIAALLVRELAGNFAPELPTGRGQRDPEAYELYLRGLHENAISAMGARRAVQLFSQAIQRDSTFADAWGALAATYGTLAQFSGDPPVDLIRRETDAANRALALDSLNTDAWGSLADRSFYLDWNFERANTERKKVIELRPNATSSHGWYAQDLHLLAMHDSAFAELRRALRLDPNDSHFVMILGYFLQAAGRLDDADTAIQRAFALDPNNWVAYVMRAKIAFKRGRNSDAIRACEQAQLLQGSDDPFSLSFLGYCYGQGGQPEKAQVVLSKLRDMARRRYVERAWFAQVYIGLGDHGAALDALEASAGAHDRDLLLAMRQTAGTLWGEPRYQDLLRRTNLVRYWKRPPPT